MVDESVLERILINRDEKPTDLPLALLQHITNNFSEVRKIGYGGFGAVYQGVLRKGSVAVKRIYVNIEKIDLDDKLFRREFISLWKTNHQNIVRCLGFCSNTYVKPIETARSKELEFANVRERLFCLEYISNGSLDKHITDELRGLEWETRYEIIIGICKGLCYLHEEKKIVHMDLKPENILLDGNYMVPKITDFGLSRTDENSHTMAQPIGTRGYIAPEYEKHGNISFKADIYSLGAIITELVMGSRSIPNKNNVLRRWRHRWGKPPTFLQYQQVTRCIETAERCRQQEPKDRPSIADIISILSEIESADGHTGQKSAYRDDDMLGIKPLDLHFTFMLNKEMSCPIKLTNKTKACFAFNVKNASSRYSIWPDRGIVTPGCNEYLVQITMKPQESAPQVTQNADKFLVQSTKVSEGLRAEDITENIFHEEDGKLVDEVDLMVSYELGSHNKGQDPSVPLEAVSRKRKAINSISNEDGVREQRDRHNFHPPENFSRCQPTNKTYLLRVGDRAVDVTRGAMGSLLHKLGELLKEEFNLETRVKKDVQSLSDGLVEMQRILHEVSKVQQDNLDEEVKRWASIVREMSYDLEDFIDGFLVHNEPDSNTSGFRELTHEMCFLLEKDKSHHAIRDLIKDKNKLVQYASGMCKGYKFDNIKPNVSAHAAIDEIRNLAIYEDEEELVGIETPRDELIRLFEEDGDVSKQNLKIVSIVGLGGLGKTTLAKAVYDQPNTQYDLKSFVSMGQNDDVKKVLKNIIDKFIDGFNAESMGDLIDKLKGLLVDKRYFIVIDDIWNSSQWNSIRSAFPKNKHGSRVITTTRDHRVARACCTNERKYVYRIKPLSDEDSRRLFFRRIFGPGKDCPESRKEISTDILNRCGGMPLAINSIASLLAGDESGSTWEYVWKSLGAVTEEDDLEKMKQILDLSYINLPGHLKTCLLHICMYREDQVIDKKDLLQQWVAEDFVVSTNGRLDAEDVAEKYFKELISMCMIQPWWIEEYSNEVLSCRVHDIILDLMRSKSSKHNFIHVMDGSKDKTRANGEIRRISIHYNDKKDGATLETIKGSLLHARSALLYQVSPVPYLPVFKYVRVLHVEYYERHLDLTDISRLFLLRYLKIKCLYNTSNMKLPVQIGELQQLETIDIQGVKLESFPSDIASLPWLSHLRYAPYDGLGIALPKGVERLKFLRTLEGINIYKSSTENINGLGKLTNLRKLQIFLEEFSKRDEATTAMCMDALQSSISMLSASLRILILGEESSSRQEDILDVPPGWISRTLFPGGSNIGELDLGCCTFARCPGWISQLRNLYKFAIRVREVADGVSSVAGLPSLAFFRLEIPDEEEKEESVVIPGGGAFQALKNLVFLCPTVALTFEAGAMPKLEKLEILFRHDMTPQLLPAGIQHLPAPTLKGIELALEMEWEECSDSDESRDKEKKDKRKLLAMMKKAFKQHHPGADIKIFYQLEAYNDEEDYEEDDNKEEHDEGVCNEEDYDDDGNEVGDDDEGVEDEEDYCCEEYQVQRCHPIVRERPVDTGRLAALEAEFFKLLHNNEDDAKTSTNRPS